MKTNLPTSVTQTSGYEGVRQSDLIIPRLRLVQKMSNLPGDPEEGTIYNTTDQSSSERVRVAVAAIRHTNVCWDDVNAERPICASDNGETPRRDISDPCSERCSTCQKSKWSVKDGNRVPPACSDRITMLVINIDDLTPALVDFYKTSYAIGRAIITTLVAKRRPPYSTPIELSSRMAQKGKYAYYVWNFAVSQFEPGAEQTIADLAEFYNSQAGILSAEMDNAREKNDDEGTNRVVDVNKTEDDVTW